MTLEGDQTTRNTSKPAQGEGVTDRQTDIFFIVLGLWEANKYTKRILVQFEKITDGNRYGNL